MNRLRAAGGALCAATALAALAFAPQCGSGGAESRQLGDASGERGGSRDASGSDGRPDDGAVDSLPADVSSADSPVEGTTPVDTGATETDAIPVYTGDACPPPLDAGIISDWPGFRRLTELDPCCPTDVALDATKTAPPVQWIPCLNGAAGCLEMKAGWNGVGGQFSGAQVSTDPAGSPANLYIYRRLANTEGEEDIYGFGTMSPLGAWRPAIGSTACFTETVIAGFSATTVAFVNSGAPPGTFVASSAPASLAASPHFVSVANTNLMLRYLQGLGSSETTLGFDLGPSIWLGRAPLDGGGYTTAVVPGQVSLAFVSRDDVFGQSTHGAAGWGQVYVFQPNNALVLLRGNPSAHVTGVATDGPNLYWAETYGSTDIQAQQTDTQIWTAPYTDDPTQLAATARQIADIKNSYVPYQAIAFGGYYATALYVVRVADGAVLPAPSAGTYTYWDLVYVTGSELWAIMGEPHGPNGIAFARVQLAPWPSGD